MKLENCHQIVTLEGVYLLQLSTIIWKISVFLSYSTDLLHINSSAKCKTSVQQSPISNVTAPVKSNEMYIESIMFVSLLNLANTTGSSLYCRTND